jgi:hypothetical protein
VTFDAGTRQLAWSGSPASGEAVTIWYTVTVTGTGPKMVKNTATLTVQGSPASSSTAMLCIDCSAQWLPIVRQ